VRIWDVTTGQEVRRLVGHSVDVWSLAFSTDSQSIVTGSGDTKARIWDVNTGKSKLELAVPDNDRVWSVAFSRDGKQVLTASNNMARLWDAASGRMIKTFAGHRYAVMSVAFSRDGKFVLTGGGYGRNDDNTARLWSVETGNELARFEGHGDVILSVAFSPNGRYALTGGGEGPTSDTIVRLWDTTTYQLVRKFEGHKGTVSSVAFSPDGKRIVTGSWDGSVIVWNVETGLPDLPHPLLGHSGMVDDARFSPDGRFILTGSRGDGTARTWSTSTGDELCQLISFKQSNQVGTNQETTQPSKEDWFVIDHDGRFDSNNLESIDGLRWVMPDDPFTPISPEIFMRPYYEPRLLPRLLADDDFREVPQLGELNRVQPRVTITEVKKAGGSGATVTVEVENVQHTYQREKNPVVESGAKDLRLFRDGQLVSYRDGNLLGQKQNASTGCEPIESAKKCRAVFEHIRLPQQEGVTSYSSTLRYPNSNMGMRREISIQVASLRSTP
jgi:dipeptidyl aminopeptidase/acylaminoacyl peptidase